MVCTSNKQHLLDNIETTIMHSLMVESKMQLDLMDVDATWHPNDDLEDSDDDMFNHAISFVLIRTYDIISQSRYTSVVGHPGSSHDVRVWASGSGIVAKPHLHLDEGEFVWVDAGYGYSSYTVGLYSNTAAAKSRDLHYFNYSLSHIHVKAKHGIAYLKNHFQCLMGFQGNLYQEEDHEKAAHMVQASEVLETMSGMEAYQQATKDARIQRRENQQQYEQEQAAAMEGMSQNRVQKFRQEKALDLREEMLTALFASHGHPFEDTTAESQRMGMTTLAFAEWQERQNRQHEAHRRQRSEQV
ncbi:hypothetical protein NDA12_005526 [Ustilago hordei]|nr:hypothetical protein NDA12_005526 [Ustilago hordei]